MSFAARWHRIVALATVFGLVVPPAIRAEAPRVSRVPSTPTHDIQLDKQGQFSGLVVNAQGRPQAGIEVTLQRIDRESAVWRGKTDMQGRFGIKPVVAGTYQLKTSEGAAVCRLWTHAAAPPSAAPTLLLVNDAKIARGQQPIHELFRSDPILMATVVAAAIAIPIAVHKSQDNDREGS